MSFVGLEEELSAESLGIAILFQIEFLSETLYLALQNTGFTDNNGQVWQPADGGLVSYDDFPGGSNLAASKRTYTLQIPDLVFGNKLVAQESEYRGRKITQFFQLFSNEGAPLSTPRFLHVGFMDVVTASFDGSGSSQLTVTAEGPLAYKNKTAYGLLTDTDQKARHPGDKALDRVKDLAKGISLAWPPS